MTLFGGARSVSVALGLNPRGYLAGLAAAGKATKDWARSAEQSIGKHRKSWDDIGSAATTAGLVIGAGAAAAVVAFARFDQSMSRAAAGTQATAKQMGALREAAIAAGRDTQFSATEAADAITAMGKAGVSVEDILSGGLGGALSLAAAGELDVGRAAEIAATAMTQFGLSGGQLPHVADLLAAGAGKAQGSVDDLANALKYVGPVAKAQNVSIEETVGVLAELASQGIISEQAGTSLRGVLSTLTAPSKAAAKAMDEAGISVFDAQGKFVGLAGVAQQLQTNLGGLTLAQRDQALGQIFGNEQITAATILMQGGGAAVRDWTKKVNDSGFAARQAGQLMDNLAGDFEQFKGSLETALIGAGSGSNAGLRQLVQGATGAVNAFSRLPGPVQQGVVVVAGLTAGTALLTAGLIKGAIAVRTMRTNLVELGVTGARTTTLMTGLGKATAGLGIYTLALEGASRIPGVTRDIEGATVKVGVLTKASRELMQGGGSEQAGTFGAGFKDLGKQLHELSDPSLGRRFNDLQQSTVAITTFGILGSTKGAPSRRQLLADLKQLDTYLTGLVQSGQVDQAKALFEKLDAGAVAGGAGVGQLAGELPEFEDALKGAGGAAGDTADATGDMGGQMDSAAKKAKDLAKQLGDVRDAARDANSAFLDSRAATRDYQAALDDAQERLKGRGDAAKKVAEAQKALRTAKTPAQKKSARADLDEAIQAQKDLAAGMDAGSKAGRDNQAALDAVAAAAQQQADAIFKVTGSDAQYRASLAKSRADLLKLARQYGLTKQQAQELIDLELAMPDTIAGSVRLDGVDEATAKLREFVGIVTTINGRKAVVAVSANSANVREDRSVTAPKGALIAQAAAGAAAAGTARRLPRRAAGGPVSAGVDYLVGEFGRERFRPWTDGYVIPHHQATAPQVVTVPVQSKTSRAVNLNGPITVVAPSPQRFTDWASAQHSFGSGGVG